MKTLFAAALCALLAASAALAQSVQHAASTGLVTSLLVKASLNGVAVNLLNFNVTGLAGGAAGFAVAYNSATVPATGALTGAQVLDYCYFDTTVRGCSLSRSPTSIPFTNGVVILITSAASPYTYTTGTLTGAIEADFN